MLFLDKEGSCFVYLVEALQNVLRSDSAPCSQGILPTSLLMERLYMCLVHSRLESQSENRKIIVCIRIDCPR